MMNLLFCRYSLYKKTNKTSWSTCQRQVRDGVTLSETAEHGKESGWNEDLKKNRDNSDHSTLQLVSEVPYFYLYLDYSKDSNYNRYHRHINVPYLFSAFFYFFFFFFWSFSSWQVFSTLGQDEPGTKGVLRISRSSSITGASLSNCLE